MTPTVVIGTANRHKLKELVTLLKGSGIRVVPVTSLGRIPEVVEDGRTFEANAAKKARVYSRLSDAVTLADDSGLCVKVLGGRPGVYSARYAGPGCMYADNNEKLLRQLAGKTGRQRGAYFQCTVALYRRGKKIKLLTARCHGFVADRPSGQKGFGYDPVFIPRGYRRTFAEMASRRKNAVSHRGRALAKTTKFLTEYFGRRPVRVRAPRTEGLSATP